MVPRFVVGLPWWLAVPLVAVQVVLWFAVTVTLIFVGIALLLVRLFVPWGER